MKNAAKGFNSILSLEYHRLIPHEERERFERMLNRIYDTRFQYILEPDNQGTFRKASVRAWYCPVLYSYFPAKPVSWIGTDIFQYPKRMNTNWLAQITGSPQISPPLQAQNIPGDSQNSLSFAISSVVRTSDIHTGLSVQGFVSTSFDFDDFIKSAALSNSSGNNIVVRVEDPTHGTMSTYPDQSIYNASHLITLPLKTNGRQWNLKFYAHPDTISFFSLWFSIAVGIMGIGATSIAAFMVFFLQKNRNDTERLNQNLQKEIEVRKVSENELVNAKIEAENASNAKSQFLAVMSHEIRTPLNGIIGMLSLVKNTRLDEEQKESIDIIDVSSRALVTLISRILKFSKLENQKEKLYLETFNLSQLLTNTTNLFHGAAQSKGLQLTRDIDPNLPLYVHSDPLRIEEILSNLLGNAVKFTDKGSIRLQALKQSGYSENEFQLFIHISDSGCGIPENQINKIFEPFEQGSRDQHGLSDGSGLGLAISSQIIKLLGGNIKVESAEGIGSTFTICIPMKIAEKPPVIPKKHEKKAESILAGKFNNIRVLYVEDNKVNQRVGQLLLNKLGCTVSIAESPSQASALIQNESFDCIFMDVNLPEQDGIMLTAMWREKAMIPTNTPVIALSASVGEDVQKKAFEHGLDDFLTKPINLESLEKVLLKWITKPD